MSHEIAKREPQGGALTSASLQKQMELIKEKFHLPETAIERNYVRVEKRVVNGKEREFYTLCKRENPITLFTDDTGRVSGAMATGYAGKMKLDVKKGKYNDEHRLDIMNGFETGIDVSEVAAFATM